jgi:hypothetical protein
VSDPTQADEIVTLTRVGELTTAQLVRGRLHAEGIECFLPDENQAKHAWYQPGAVRGIRVQVRQADLEQAREILAAEGGDEVEPTPPAPGEAAEDGTISEGDRAAFRSLRVALVTILLMGLLHPYSAWLALRALGRGDITDWGRRRAGIALLVSLAGCAWLGMVVYRLVHAGG